MSLCRISIKDILNKSWNGDVGPDQPPAVAASPTREAFVSTGQSRSHSMQKDFVLSSLG